MPTVCFTKSEMEAFANASGDLNPLHRTEQRSAARHFEEPVVYGVLGVLAALGALEARSGLVLRALDARFLRPLFPASRYRLEVHEADALNPTVLISDGGLRACVVRASFARGVNRPAHVGEESDRLARPREPCIAELESARSVTGRYGASHAAVRRLEERFRLAARGVGDYALQGLLQASYLLGMRLPGLGSLLSRLQLVLTPLASVECEPSRDESLTYRASAVEFEADLGEATISCTLEHGQRRVAMCTCHTHLPPAPARVDRHRLERHLAVSDRLAGQVAVVVGASRGLGAVLALGMATQGCAVYTCGRSAEGPDRHALSWPGSIKHVRGDGSDPEFCGKLLELAVERHGGVDFLLCCAAPQLGAIGFGPHSMPRFGAYVQQSIKLVAVPMATFLESVQARAGGCLMVSSSALTTLPGEWGHYVTAKAAAEALAAWSAKRFPAVEMVVARLPRIGSGQELPETSKGKIGPEQAAAQLVGRLAERVGSGVYLMEW